MSNIDAVESVKESKKDKKKKDKDKSDDLDSDLVDIKNLDKHDIYRKASQAITIAHPTVSKNMLSDKSSKSSQQSKSKHSKRSNATKEQVMEFALEQKSRSRKDTMFVAPTTINQE